MSNDCHILDVEFLASSKEMRVNDDNKTTTESHERKGQSLLSSFFGGLIREAVKLIIAFAVGTGAGAIVCWYYGIPLIVSLLGGVLVLALALAFTTDSLFS